MILKMIDDGKITAEEGVKLLEALEKTESGKNSTDTSLSTRVNWEEGRRKTKSYRQVSGANKFATFIESAIQKIKEVDLDFNFGTYMTVHHIFHHRQLTEATFDISVENGSVTLVPWNEEDVRLECEAKVYRARDAEEAKQTFLREVTMTGDGEKLKIYSKQKTIKLQATIYVPQKQYQAITLYTFNGHLKGEHLRTNKIEAKAVNGSISFDHLDTKKLAAETVHGPIDIVETNANACDVRTVNGAITINGMLPDVDVETVNGTITYELKGTSDTRNYADFKATTGSIHVSVPHTYRVEGNLKTNVGGFTCDLDDLEIIEEKKDFAQKQTVFLAGPEKVPSLKLKASTNTGSISVQNVNQGSDPLVNN